MPDKKVEHIINFKFLVKLGKCATNSFRLLTDIYGYDVMSRSRDF